MLTSVVVTGSFDGKIRFWQHQTFKPMSSLPFLTLEAHSSPINAIVFSKDYQRMYTGSGSGTLKVWKQEISEDGINYSLLRSIDNLKDSPVYSLTEHPVNEKILVRTSQGIQTFDPRLFRLTNQFILPTQDSSRKDLEYVSMNRRQNGTKVNIFLKASYSPCGNYVFAGTNDGRVGVWKADTGNFYQIYSPETLNSWQNSGLITDISFHPLDHSVAFSVWGQMEPIRVYTWDASNPSFRETSAAKAPQIHGGPLRG